MRKLLKVLFAALSLTVLFVSCELLLGSDEDKKEEGPPDYTRLSSLTVGYGLEGDDRVVNLGPEFSSATTCIMPTYILPLIR